VDYSRIEVDLLYKKKISMNFYEMVSRDSTNCLDRGISLRNRNPCYQKIVWNKSIIHFGILLNKNGDIVPPLINNFDFWEVSRSSNNNGFNFFK